MMPMRLEPATPRSRVKHSTSIQNNQFKIDDIISPLLHNDALKYLVFENIIENGAFAQKEQMLHFP